MEHILLSSHTHLPPPVYQLGALRAIFSKRFRDLPTLLLPSNRIPKLLPANWDHCISLFARRHDDT